MATKDIKSSDKSNSILIVEDDEFISDVYMKKLALEGFEMDLAKDGEEALRKIRDRKPDIVLLDIMIPLKDGFQVLTELHADAALSDIRVVVMSNLSQGKDIARAKELGALDYIVKSNVSLPDMVQRIRKALTSS
ncbi:MAG: response regulator [Candidatus Moraniibacteriota bacterium]|nr:MAG: response regulator [Candidatus Moranbacteria bacterium]